MTLFFFIMWCLSGLVGAVTTCAYCSDNQIKMRSFNKHSIRVIILLGALFFGPLAFLFLVYVLLIKGDS